MMLGTAPTVFWPALLGVVFLAAGLMTYRRDLNVVPRREAFGLIVFGPAFIAAAIAAFAGEHFTAGPALATLVPTWMPGRLFIAYFVGAAHLAAASSFVARRYVRLSSSCLALMFALFVLLMDLPGAMARPQALMSWSLAARQATFATGALALLAIEIRFDRPKLARMIVVFARLWTACVLVFYGLEHFLNPQFTAGVPSTVVTAAWVPAPLVVSYATGAILVALGIGMFVERRACAAASQAGLLMSVLTAVLYVPQFVLAHDASNQVVAINFIFDTLLFAGTMLVIGRAIGETSSPAAASTA